MYEEEVKDTAANWANAEIKRIQSKKDLDTMEKRYEKDRQEADLIRLKLMSRVGANIRRRVIKIDNDQVVIIDYNPNGKNYVNLEVLM